MGIRSEGCFSCNCCGKIDVGSGEIDVGSGEIDVECGKIDVRHGEIGVVWRDIWKGEIWTTGSGDIFSSQMGIGDFLFGCFVFFVMIKKSEKNWKVQSRIVKKWKKKGKKKKYLYFSFALYI